MHVSQHDREKLKLAVQEIAGDAVSARVFGSRLDDNGRGGDLDLYVELNTEVDNPVWIAARIVARAQTYLGDRHIDVVLRDAATPELPIHCVGRETGVIL